MHDIHISEVERNEMNKRENPAPPPCLDVSTALHMKKILQRTFVNSYLAPLALTRLATLTTLGTLAQIPTLFPIIIPLRIILFIYDGINNIIFTALNSSLQFSCMPRVL